MLVADRLARRSRVGEILGPLRDVLAGEASQRKLAERRSDVLPQIRLVIPERAFPQTGQMLDVVLDPLPDSHGRHVRVGPQRRQRLLGSELVDQLS